MSPKLFYVAFLAALVVIFIFTYQKSLAPEYSQIRVRQLRQPYHQEHPTSKLTHRYIPRGSDHTGNLPDLYLKDTRKPMGFNKTCARFPDFFVLKFQNDNWQMQSTTNGTFHLFNAYVDSRNGSVVRIVAMYDVYRPNATFFCQFWYQGTEKPKFMESEVLFWMFHVKWGADTAYFHHPYIITCPLLLHNGKLPFAVSLVEKPCDNATNSLKLFSNEKKEKKNFVVCVKGLSFPFEDTSARLAEWIELVNILGAEKINFYEFSVHPNAQKVLSYYEDQGLVEVTPVTLVGDYSNHAFLQNLFLRKKITQRRLEEVITFNDCLYKHLQEFKYVVLLDIDEVIVPVEDTWVELIETLEKTLPKVDSYVARNVYFLDAHLHNHSWFEDIPRYMHMLQHVYRAEAYTKPGHFIKGFHSTSTVFALHNHFPFKCLKPCINKEVSTDLMHLQHYRVDCSGGTSDCQSMKKNSVLDKRLWRFKEELIVAVGKTLKDLELI